MSNVRIINVFIHNEISDAFFMKTTTQDIFQHFSTFFLLHILRKKKWFNNDSEEK